MEKTPDSLKCLPYFVERDICVRSRKSLPLPGKGSTKQICKRLSLFWRRRLAKRRLSSRHHWQCQKPRSSTATGTGRRTRNWRQQRRKWLASWPSPIISRKWLPNIVSKHLIFLYVVFWPPCHTRGQFLPWICKLLALYPLVVAAQVVFNYCCCWTFEKTTPTMT